LTPFGSRSCALGRRPPRAVLSRLQVFEGRRFRGGLLAELNARSAPQHGEKQGSVRCKIMHTTRLSGIDRNPRGFSALIGILMRNSA
jgi:hypothetical protein